MKTSNADKWFSRFIRLRDSEAGYSRCCTCGTIKLTKSMDCGHYIKRQHKATRFNEINCQTQCKHCNNFEQGADIKFRKFLVDKYGEDKVILLESQKHKTSKLGKFEIEIISNEYKKQVEYLLNLKQIKKWW